MAQMKIGGDQIDQSTLTLSTLGGTLAATQGGTGQTGFATGDILYASSTTALSKLTVGSTGQVLTVAAGAPSWAAAAGGSSYTLQPVRVATTANGTLASAFANGQTVDGQVLATNDRILLKNQSAGAENGVYVVAASGAPARAADFTTGAATLTGGALIPVRMGTVSGGKIFQCTNTTAITIGTTAITFNSAGTATTLNTGGILIGPLASITAGGSGSIAIGGSVDSNSGIAIGQSAACTNGASNAGGVAIGTSATVTAQRGVAIGQSATAAQGIAIGCAATNTTATADSVAIGIPCLSASGGVAIGKQQQAGTNGVAIGFIGTGSYAATGANAVSIGSSTGASGSSSIGIGTNASAGVGNDICIGSNSRTGFAGQMSFTNAKFSANNDIANAMAIPFGVTTTATPLDLLCAVDDNATTTPTGTLNLQTNNVTIWDVMLAARQNTTTDSSAWNISFAMKVGASAATTALLGSVTTTLIGQDAGAAAWAVAVTADTTNGRVKITVTGETGKTIRWVANCKITRIAG